MGDLKNPVGGHAIGAKLGTNSIADKITKSNPIKAMARKLRGSKGAQLPDIDHHSSRNK